LCGPKKPADTHDATVSNKGTAGVTGG